MNDIDRNIRTRNNGVFGGYILTGRQHGGAPAYECDSGAGYYVWKDNDGTWRANHDEDGGIGGDNYIRIELQTELPEDHVKFYNH